MQEQISYVPEAIREIFPADAYRHGEGRLGLPVDPFLQGTCLQPSAVVRPASGRIRRPATAYSYGINLTSKNSINAVSLPVTDLTPTRADVPMCSSNSPV